MRYSISSNFKNLLMNWVKYVFYWEKLNFVSIGNFAHTAGFLTLEKVLLILLPLYLQMLIVQISTQADNHKYRKSVVTKKVLFKKMSLKFRDPKFNILCKLVFIFFMNSQPFGVQRSI